MRAQDRGCGQGAGNVEEGFMAVGNSRPAVSIVNRRSMMVCYGRLTPIAASREENALPYFESWAELRKSTIVNFLKAAHKMSCRL